MSVTPTKSCRQCGDIFPRVKNLSATQWEDRQYCSRRCSGLKRSASDQWIVDKYANEVSSGEIAKELNISGVQVLRILHKNKVTLRTLSEGKVISHSRPETKEKMSKSALGRKCPEHVKAALRLIVGPKHQGWKGGITLNAGGYLQFTESPANGAHAGVYIHRIIAEWVVGRKIQKGEVVHHLDGNKKNNNPDNLQVMSASSHARMHAIENNLGRRKRK